MLKISQKSILVFIQYQPLLFYVAFSSYWSSAQAVLAGTTGGETQFPACSSLEQELEFVTKWGRKFAFNTPLPITKNALPQLKAAVIRDNLDLEPEEDIPPGKESAKCRAAATLQFKWRPEDPTWRLSCYFAAPFQGIWRWQEGNGEQPSLVEIKGNVLQVIESARPSSSAADPSLPKRTGRSLSAPTLTETVSKAFLDESSSSGGSLLGKVLAASHDTTHISFLGNNKAVIVQGTTTTAWECTLQFRKNEKVLVWHTTENGDTETWAAVTSSTAPAGHDGDDLLALQDTETTWRQEANTMMKSGENFAFSVIWPKENRGVVVKIESIKPRGDPKLAALGIRGKMLLSLVENWARELEADAIVLFDDAKLETTNGVGAEAKWPLSGHLMAKNPGRSSYYGGFGYFPLPAVSEVLKETDVLVEGRLYNDEGFKQQVKEALQANDREEIERVDVWMARTPAAPFLAEYDLHELEQVFAKKCIGELQDHVSVGCIFKFAIDVARELPTTTAQKLSKMLETLWGTKKDELFIQNRMKILYL